MVVEIRNNIIQTMIDGSFPPTIGIKKDDRRYKWWSSDNINEPFVKISNLNLCGGGRYRYASDYPLYRREPEPLPVEKYFLDIEVLYEEGEEINTEGNNLIPCMTIWKMGEDKGIIYKDEAAILNRVISLLNDPTVLLMGWNIHFDIMYLLSRIKVQYNRSINVEAKCVDYMSLYTKYISKSNKADKLDFVLQKELGTGKLSFEGSLYQLYHADKEKYYKYNYRDVEGLVQLEEKLNIVVLCERILTVSNSRWDDILYNTRLIENHLFRLLRVNGMVFRNKNRTCKREYPGAVVYDPIPGIYINRLRCYDFASLYPMVIGSHNISPETKGGIGINLITGRSYTLPEQYMGIYPQLMKLYLSERNRLKAENDHNGQLAMKILANSCYGAMGSEYFRLYDPDIAEDITQTARRLNFIIAYIMDEMLQGNDIPDYTKISNVYPWGAGERKHIIYGHTDSVFIDCSDSLEEEINMFLEWYSENELCNPDFKLSVKDEYGLINGGLFRKVKSNYFLMLKDKLKIVGGKGIASSASKVTQDVINGIISLLLTGEPVSSVRSVVNEIKSEIDPYDPEIYPYYSVKSHLNYAVMRRPVKGLDTLEQLGYSFRDVYFEKGIVVELLGEPRTQRCTKKQEIPLSIPYPMLDQLSEILGVAFSKGYQWNHKRNLEHLFGDVETIIRELEG